MDLTKIGKLLCDLRKAKGMTQKQVADVLGVLPKTISKWETGRGFPDVSVITPLADVLGVSERILLSGDMVKKPEIAVNMKRTKFYVCPDCGAVMQSTGECQIICCGKVIEPLKSRPCDEEHNVCVSQIENDLYVEINHTMTKEHYISFVAYVGYDRVLFIKMYPEQDSAVRLPKMCKGKLYVCCNKDRLFESDI